MTSKKGNKNKKNTREEELDSPNTKISKKKKLVPLKRKDLKYGISKYLEEE